MDTGSAKQHSRERDSPHETPSHKKGSTNAATGSVPEEEQECYQPKFTLMGLNNFTAPWPEQCTYNLTAIDTENTDPMDDPCWCIPDEGTEGCCPDPKGRPISYGWQVADAFKTHVETSDPILLHPTGCDPFNDVYASNTYSPNFMQGPGKINGTCDKFEGADNPDAVCAFLYDVDDEECGPQFRNYELKTYGSFEEAIADGAVVTHYGCKLS